MAGSSLVKRPLASVEMATPRPVASSTRMTPASSGWHRAVSPRTKRSYWSVTQAVEAWLGLVTTARTCSASSVADSGRARRSVVSALSASCQAGRA